MVVETSLLSFLQVLFLKLGWIFSYCYLSHQPTSIPITNDKSPRELLFHQNRDYNFLKVYGCACWPQQSQIGFLVQTLHLSWLQFQPQRLQVSELFNKSHVHSSQHCVWWNGFFFCHKASYIRKSNSPISSHISSKPAPAWSSRSIYLSIKISKYFSTNYSSNISSKFSTKYSSNISKKFFKAYFSNISSIISTNLSNYSPKSSTLPGSRNLSPIMPPPSSPSLPISSTNVLM